jgi:hypothetical protein
MRWWQCLKVFDNYPLHRRERLPNDTFTQPTTPCGLSRTPNVWAISLSLLKWVGQASVIDEANGDRGAWHFDLDQGPAAGIGLGLGGQRGPHVAHAATAG